MRSLVFHGDVMPFLCHLPKFVEYGIYFGEIHPLNCQAPFYFPVSLWPAVWPLQCPLGIWALTEFPLFCTEVSTYLFFRRYSFSRWTLILNNNFCPLMVLKCSMLVGCFSLGTHTPSSNLPCWATFPLLQITLRIFHSGCLSLGHLLYTRKSVH